MSSIDQKVTNDNIAIINIQKIALYKLIKKPKISKKKKQDPKVRLENPRS